MLSASTGGHRKKLHASQICYHSTAGDGLHKSLCGRREHALEHFLWATQHISVCLPCLQLGEVKSELRKAEGMLHAVGDPAQAAPPGSRAGSVHRHEEVSPITRVCKQGVAAAGSDVIRKQAKCNCSEPYRKGCKRGCNCSEHYRKGCKQRCNCNEQYSRGCKQGCSFNDGRCLLVLSAWLLEA